MRSVVVGVLVAGASCSFSADYGGTTYRCEAGVCPAGYTCGSDGYCRMGADAAGNPADAPVAPADADLEAPDGSSVLDPPWWDGNWMYRRRITVHNVSSTTLAQNDYEVGVALDIDALTGGGSWDQIRVMHHDPNDGDILQMVRVIDDTAGTDEHLWFPLWETLGPDDSVDHYWLYYGNDLSPSGVQNNPADLFTFHASLAAADGRLEVNGTATFGGGEMTLQPGASVRTLSPYRWGTGYALDFVLDVPTWDSRFWGGFQRVNDFADDQPWIIWISRAGSEIWPEFLAHDTGNDVIDEGTHLPVDPGPRIYSIERFPTATVFRFEHGFVDRLTHGSYTTDLQARLTNESAEPLVFDMLRIRRAADPPPEVTLGPVETRP